MGKNTGTTKLLMTINKKKNICVEKTHITTNSKATARTVLTRTSKTPKPCCRKQHHPAANTNEQKKICWR